MVGVLPIRAAYTLFLIETIIETFLIPPGTVLFVIENSEKLHPVQKCVLNTNMQKYFEEVAVD